MLEPDTGMGVVEPGMGMRPQDVYLFKVHVNNDSGGVAY